MTKEELKAHWLEQEGAIVEEGIERIHFSLTSTRRGWEQPLHGLVKWFHDEHGQRWTKLRRILPGDGYRTVCYPADRVVYIMYEVPNP